MVDKISSKERYNFITSGNIYKVLFWVALPLIGNTFIVKFFDLTNVYFSSFLGVSELTAILFVTPIINIALGLANALAIGINAYLAQSLVSDANKIKQQKLTSTWSFTIVMAFSITIISVIFGEPILRLLNATDFIITDATIYFKIMMLGVFFEIITYYYFGYTRAKADMKTTFTLSLASNIIRFIFSVLCVYVFEMGIIGLSIANVLPKILTGLYASFKLNCEPHFNIFKIKIHKKYFIPFFILLLPIAVDKLSMAFGFVVLNSVIISFDEAILSAFSITNGINSLFFSMTIGFATGLVTIISYNRESANIKRCQEIMKSSIRILLIFSVIVSIVLYTQAEIIAPYFSADDPVIESATVNAMRTYSISIYGYGYAQIYFGLYYALKRPRIAMTLSLLRMWLFRIGIIVLLIHFTDLKQYAIWIGMLLSNFALLPLIYAIQKDSELSFGEKK